MQRPSLFPNSLVGWLNANKTRADGQFDVRAHKSRSLFFKILPLGNDLLKMGFVLITLKVICFFIKLALKTGKMPSLSCLLWKHKNPFLYTNHFPIKTVLITIIISNRLQYLPLEHPAQDLHITCGQGRAQTFGGAIALNWTKPPPKWLLCPTAKCVIQAHFLFSGPYLIKVSNVSNY